MPKSSLPLTSISSGLFEWELWDGGKPVARGAFHNTSTVVGRNLMQNCMFNGTSQSSTWYMGLIDEDDFDSLSVNDTMSSHSGWTENTDYSQGTRPEWAADTAAGGSITNSTRATFTISADTSIVGCFVINENTKSGTTGTLFSTGRGSAPRRLTNGQSLKVSYTHTLATGGQ